MDRSAQSSADRAGHYLQMLLSRPAGSVVRITRKKGTKKADQRDTMRIVVSTLKLMGIPYVNYNSQPNKISIKE